MLCERDGAISVGINAFKVRARVSRQFLERQLSVLVFVPFGKDLLGILRGQAGGGEEEQKRSDYVFHVIES